MKQLIVLAGLMGVLAVGCDRTSKVDEVNAEEPVVAAPEPEGEMDSSVEAANVDGLVGVEVTETTAVEMPEAVNLDPLTDENRAVREEVLKRIDQIPSLKPEDKDRFYVRVDRAQGMGKVITIPFASGETRIGKTSADALGAKLEQKQVRELVDDPTVVFVVLGFADTKGDPEKNLSISLERAESALEVLRDRYGMLNVMHAVGMGSSELLGDGELDKNRVVEVWAVVP